MLSFTATSLALGRLVTCTAERTSWFTRSRRVGVAVAPVGTSREPCRSPESLDSARLDRKSGHEAEVLAMFSGSYRFEREGTSNPIAISGRLLTLSRHVAVAHRICVGRLTISASRCSTLASRIVLSRDDENGGASLRSRTLGVEVDIDRSVFDVALARSRSARRTGRVREARSSAHRYSGPQAPAVLEPRRAEIESSTNAAEP